MNKKIFSLEESRRNEKLEFAKELMGGIFIAVWLYVMTVLVFSL